ncbi:MAG: putative PIN and TRAM-domain containing protein precursor [Candidatus Omnitrophica bacterium ADurb.Bin277]|nr:MAG: putative PIN and TRAM-domain containing protein precursor [Candidatus Omnitrophica bacterium ADurb.Bin277]
MILFIRFLFIAGCAAFGYYSEILSFLNVQFLHSTWVSALIGALIGFIIVMIDVFFKQYTVRNILSVILGLALGLITHKLFMMVVAYADLTPEMTRNFGIASAIIFSYLGIITILRGQDEFSLMIPFVHLDTKGAKEDLVLLDTSVIIDGRIADIANTHFMGGKLILPRFVLKELQLISDSSDPLKRNRGRRGLDVLNAIRENPNVTVKIHEMDFPEFNTVDAKLVKMAQVIEAKVFTNDYNLNKVAELQGVKVLNINDLANALKPVVMPGEEMEIKILKEGKEHEQGIAYLDDGTMVVVDSARRRIGQTVRVTITSVLQTQAGRMIFAKLSDEDEGRRDRHERGRGDRWHDRGRDRHDRGRNGHGQPHSGPHPQNSPAPNQGQNA